MLIAITIWSLLNDQHRSLFKLMLCVWRSLVILKADLYYHIIRMLGLKDNVTSKQLFFIYAAIPGMAGCIKE
mgnify:CR=1 FL=1